MFRNVVVCCCALTCASASSYGQISREVLTLGQSAPDGADLISDLVGHRSHLVNGRLVTTAGNSSGWRSVFDQPFDALPIAYRPGWAPPEGAGTSISLEATDANSAGDVLMHATIVGPPQGLGLYLVNGATRTTIVRLGSSAPGGGTFDGLGQSQVNESGSVAVYAQLAGSVDAIFLKPGGQPLHKIAKAGEVAPRGGLFARLDGFDLVSNGQLAFHGTLDSGTFGVFAYNGSTVSAVALSSDIAPGGAVPYSFLSYPIMNDGGRIVFSGGGVRANRAIYSNDGATTSRVIGNGNSAPGGSSFSAVYFPGLNNAGQIAFIGALADGSSGLFRADPDGSIVQIARSGLPLPDSSGSYTNFAPLTSGSATARLALAAGGQVAYLDFLPSNPVQQGIYLGDGTESILVARWGQIINGRAVTKLDWAAQLNDDGQLAYIADFADGTRSQVLFTPTLHWRSSTSGDWSDAGNWTVGLTPASVHPIVIDSPNSVTVTTPSGITTVKSVEVGAGNVLTLSPGSDLVVSEGLTIASGAAVYGSGAITGDVTNHGSLSPGNSPGTITIAGDYTQIGQLLLELLGDDSDQLVIVGTANLTGDIYVTGSANVGQTFELIVAGGFTGSPVWHLPGESTLSFIPGPGGTQVAQITYVPEPALLGLSGVVAVLVCRRRNAG